MKTLSLFALVALCVSCTDCPPGPDCINPCKTNRRLVCEDILDPVCGCDGKTYDNACQADNAGVKSYTRGACAGQAPTANPQ